MYIYIILDRVIDTHTIILCDHRKMKTMTLGIGKLIVIVQ